MTVEVLHLFCKVISINILQVYSLFYHHLSLVIASIKKIYSFLYSYLATLNLLSLFFFPYESIKLGEVVLFFIFIYFFG